MPVKVVCAIIRKRYRVFCVQKGETGNPSTSHKWEFPGGKVEEGEFQQQAVRRELKEELDYDVKVDVCVVSRTHTYPDAEIELHAWRCSPKKNANYTLKEHVDARWVPIWKLSKMDFVEADKYIIRKIRLRRLIWYLCGIAFSCIGIDRYFLPNFEPSILDLVVDPLFLMIWFVFGFLFI